MITITVTSGETLSGIASQHGASWESVWHDNPGITNPNLIFVGEKILIPSGGSWTPPSPSAPAPAPVTSYAPAHTSSPSSVPTAATGGLSDVPGVPSGFASCVAYRESTDLENPAANGNAYGIIPASGYNVEGTSLANQKQVFKEIYDSAGPVAWAADGCPGT